MPYNENDTALYIEIDPNDRSNFKITKDDDFINSDAQLSDMAEDVISNLIDATHDVIENLVDQYDNSGGFGKVFISGQIAFIGLTYKTLINLRDERIANGDVGFRDEIVAAGQVIGEVIVSSTAALAGRFIPTNPDSPGKNFIKKAGADIALGIAAGEAYQNLKIPGTDSTSKELVGDFLRGAYDYISKFFFADDSGKTMVTDQSKDDLNNLDSLSNILIIDNNTQSIDSYVIKDGSIISDFEQKYNLNSDKLSELINQFTVFQNAEDNTSYYLIPNITDQYRQQDYISDIFDIALFDDYNFNLDLNFSEAFEEFFQELNGNRFTTSDYLNDINNLFNFDNKLSIDQIFYDYASGKFLSSGNLSDNYFTINSDLQDGYYLQDFNLNVNGNYSYNNLNPVNEFLEIQTSTIEISRDDVDNLESALQNEEYYDLSEVYDHYLEVEEEYSKTLEYVTDEFANLQERAAQDFEKSFDLLKENNPENWINLFEGFRASYINQWSSEFDNFINEAHNDLYFSTIGGGEEYYDANNEILVTDIDAGLKAEYQNVEFWDFDWDLDFIEYDGSEFLGDGYYEAIGFFDPHYNGTYFSENDWYEWYDNNNDGYIDEEEYNWIDFDDLREEITGYILYDVGISWDTFEENFDGDLDYLDWAGVDSGEVEGLEDGDWYDGYKFIDDYYNIEDYWDIESVEIETKTYYIDYYSIYEDAFFDIEFEFEDATSWIDNAFDFDVSFSSDFIFDQILSAYQNFDEFEFEFNLDNVASYHSDTGLNYFNDLDFNYLESNESSITIEVNNDRNNIITTSSKNIEINSLSQTSEIISLKSDESLVKSGQGNDMFIVTNGVNNLYGEQGDDFYIFDNKQTSITTINDDGGVIIIDDQVLSGVATQVEDSNDFILNGYSIALVNNDLNIKHGSLGRGLITIKDFQDSKYGIDLNYNPTSNLDTINTDENTNIIIDIDSYASDIDQDQVKLYSVTQGQNGTTTIDQVNNQITYTPNENYHGIDSFKYLIGDDKGGFLEKTVEVNINSINDNLTTNILPPITPEDNSIITDILGEEDTDIQINLDEIEQERILNQNITIVAALGSASYNENTGLLTYTPTGNWSGIDNIIYNIKDNDGNIVRTNTMNLLVSPINDNPFGNTANKEIMVGDEININLAALFSDIEGDNVTLLVNAKNQIGLPEWLNFDKETGILSGTVNKNGKTIIEVTASDENGGIYQTNFNIFANINLSEAVANLPEIEIINGTDFNDRIEAKKDKQDLISTGDGDDEIIYVQDNVWQDTDIISFFAWNVYSGDLVSVNGKQQSFDSFDGGVGNDTLSLTSGNDVLFLDDPITSSLSNSARISGIEIINGGKGDDIIDLSSLNYEYGDVELNGEDGDDVLWSNSGDDTLNGGDGNDNIQAGTGNDILNGGEGDDVLKGYDGDDILTGGLGIDILTGGFGYDSFDFSFLDDSTINKSDLITDFTQGEDSINFSNFAFMAIAQGEGGNGTIGYNYDEETDITTIADPDSDFALQLSGKIDLTNDDFNF